MIGPRPLVENIATLMEPPASECAEAQWVSGVVASADCDLLLGLHNVAALERIDRVVPGFSAFDNRKVCSWSEAQPR